jgi:DNA repair exonuclease SbcCD nuclease subunit
MGASQLASTRAVAGVVLVADTHLGFDLPAHPRVSRRRRGDDFFANYERVLRHVLGHRPDALVHAGDFFFRSRVAAPVVDRAFEALAGVASEGVPVVIAPGNHDRSRLPPSIWLAHPGIHVLDRPRTVVLEGGRARLAIGGFPFVRGDLRAAFPGKLQESGLASADADFRLLCFHQTVAGARVGPHGFTFRSGPDVLPPERLPRALAAVLAGHIHRAQVLDSNDGPPVLYPGSTERTSFAERNEPKGFFDVTLAAGTGGSGAAVEASFVELPARPMVDVALPGGEPAQVVARLRQAARVLDPESVVRLTAAAGVTAQLARQLTAPLLREIFPATMNVQLSRELIDACE